MTGGMTKKKAKNKFGAKKKVIDGITFASKAEADYYCELKLRKKAGDVKDFELQPKFEILPKFEKHGKRFNPITYTADFKVIHIVEIKGFATRDYQLRAKLFNFTYRDIKFTVVKAR